MLKLVHTTVADAEQAEHLARMLVTQGVAACVQTMPIRSTYRWQGKLEQNAEVMMVIKTSDLRVQEVCDVLEREHPYDVPEIVTLDAGGVSEPYAAWVREQTATKE